LYTHSELQVTYDKDLFSAPFHKKHPLLLLSFVDKLLYKFCSVLNLGTQEVCIEFNSLYTFGYQAA